MTPNPKQVEYDRLMQPRQRPSGLWEHWETVDGKPVRRVLPGFMVALNPRRVGCYHAPGSTANLKQKAEVLGAEAVIGSPNEYRPILRPVSLFGSMDMTTGTQASLRSIIALGGWS